MARQFDIEPSYSQTSPLTEDDKCISQKLKDVPFGWIMDKEIDRMKCFFSEALYWTSLQTVLRYLSHLHVSDKEISFELLFNDATEMVLVFTLIRFLKLAELSSLVKV